MGGVEAREVDVLMDRWMDRWVFRLGGGLGIDWLVWHGMVWYICISEAFVLSTITPMVTVWYRIHISCAGCVLEVEGRWDG